MSTMSPVNMSLLVVMVIMTCACVVAAICDSRVLTKLMEGVTRQRRTRSSRTLSFPAV